MLRYQFCFHALTAESDRYIASTHRNLISRIFEPKLSYRTDRALMNPSFYVIRNNSNDHTIGENYFEILLKVSYSLDLRIVESLCIYQEKPELNCNDTPTKLYTLSQQACLTVGLFIRLTFKPFTSTYVFISQVLNCVICMFFKFMYLIIELIMI